MNDRFGVYDMDSYGGNAYQAASVVQQSIQQQQQQQQQRFAGSNTPTMENYDPTRINAMNVNTYNANIHVGGTRQLAQTHQAMMPGGALPVTQGMNGMAQHQQPIRGVADFDPLPLSTAALHRLNHPSQTAAMGGHHQTVDLGMNNMGILVHQQHSHIPVSAPSSGPATPVPDPLRSTGNGRSRQSKQKPKPEEWLEELRLSVSGISLEPMSGTAVLGRVEMRTQQVMTRYLPCVDFLVQCQQELRKGLAAATTKRLVHHMFRNAMTPRQFYNTYIANLPERFYRKFKRIMAADDLNAAVKELQTLCANARGVERQGCEIVKNTFLGGMKDGESWGLRKWLSKHGGALHICNDSEIILHSCQKLDRSLASTQKLSARMRPLAKRALTKLKSEVPASYQEHSTAHPYLPFFHRLEAALKGVSNFDPEDDDVICIDDDDEVEELKAKAPPPKREKKRKATPTPPVGASTHKRSASSQSDNDSIVEIFDALNPSKPSRTLADGVEDIHVTDDSKYMQELLKTFDDDGDNIELFGGGNPDFDSIALGGTIQKDSEELVNGLDILLIYFQTNQEGAVRPANIASSAFWDTTQKYASVLRILIDILRTPDAAAYVERVNEQDLVELGNPHYSRLIKHPLCFRDIVTALIEDADDLNKTVSSNSGLLPGQGLDAWNMWRGNDLLQAIDLVFLNSLAFSKVAVEGTAGDRTTTNRLRKTLWAGIQAVIDTSFPAAHVEEKRRIKPTRRGESSGFVVLK